MEVIINPVIEPIVCDFKAALQATYGNRLHDVVLYGSYARGDYDEESDIDLMVVLNDEQLDTIAEVWKLSDLHVDFLDRYGKIISVLPVPLNQYEHSLGPVYQNARQEGILL